MAAASPPPAGPSDPAQVRRLARAVSRLESGAASLGELLGELGLSTPAGFIVGVTGPPGAGKSTLVDKLTRTARAAGQTVAVVAVDPSSPFSGGALLGDRIRMMEHSGDRGVFIRSMAARRALGGLAAATRDVARLLAAAGFDLVLVETVGVGQSELDVVRAADSVVVVLVPGLGDSVQTLKAGLLEIADVFVVNMADRPGADRTVSELRMMQTLAPRREDWEPPVIETVATEGRGLDALWAALGRHRAQLVASGTLQARRERGRRADLDELISQGLRARLAERLERDGALATIARAAVEGELDARTAADRILDALIRP